MKKTLVKVLSTAALATMMMVTPVMASTSGLKDWQTANNGTVKFTKEITLINEKSNVACPVTSVNFTIASGTEDVDSGIYAGPVAAITNADNISADFSSAKLVTTTEGETTKAKWSADASVQIDSTELKHTIGATEYEPGIYRYVITETDPLVDGLTSESSTYTLDVYASGYGDKASIEVVMYKTGDGAITIVDGKPVVANKTNLINNDYDVTTLTLWKDTTGSQGDINQPFDFTISFTPASNDSDAYYYKFVTIGTDGAPIDLSETWTKVDYNELPSISLKDNEGIVFSGLSAGDQYVITETMAGKDGYSTTITGTRASEETITKDGDNDKTITAVIGGDDGNAVANTVKFENKRDVVTPTGVITTFAPYAMMVAAAGALSAFFLGKKKREEF